MWRDIKNIKKGLIGLALASLGTAEAGWFDGACPTGILLCVKGKGEDQNREVEHYDQVSKITPWTILSETAGCDPGHEGAASPLAPLKKKCEESGGTALTFSERGDVRGGWKKKVKELGIDRVWIMNLWNEANPEESIREEELRRD